jgi:non-specific serine/threonine protein kinase
MALFLRGRYGDALKIIRETIGEPDALVHEVEGRPLEPGKMAASLLDNVCASLANPPTLLPREESVFVRQGEYWTIHYQGRIARFKATRGLHCLACLLRHPGREFHVSELIAALLEVPVAAAAGLVGSASKESSSQVRTGYLRDAGPILDARAKVEYARRLAELREELEKAERFNDSERAARARQEMDYIADQLAVTVGLGGRNRRAASQAERARSAVTKRLKDSIDKISKAMPTLGRHLATRVKTGYFCSYNPHPDRPVKWKLGP